jgi:hypothetical protein
MTERTETLYRLREKRCTNAIEHLDQFSNRAYILTMFRDRERNPARKERYYGR